MLLFTLKKIGDQRALKYFKQVLPVYIKSNSLIIDTLFVLIYLFYSSCIEILINLLQLEIEFLG